MTNDITVRFPLNPIYTWTPIVASGTTASINRGEPTKLGSAGAVAICVDGDGTSSTRITGIAKNTSSETASAAGVVTLWQPLPGIEYACKSKDLTATNTQAKIDALFGKRVVFDLTSTTWSIDTGASDASTNGVIITGGEYQTSTVFFYLSPQCTVLF